MKRKIALALVLSSVVLIAVSLFALNQLTGFSFSKQIPIMSAEEVKLEQAVIENDTSCYVDGICKITLEDGKWFIWNLGLSSKRNEYNNCQMPNMGEIKQGDALEIFGQLYPDGEIRLCGDKYYVRKVEGA